MIEVDLEKLSEVRLCWDWEIATLPKEIVKGLAYELDFAKVILKMDAAYLESHFCQLLEEGKPETDETILQALENKDIWEIEIHEQGEYRKIFDLPSNRKEIYASEKIWAVEWDAPNLCETHTRQGECYIIEWKLPTQEEIAMKINEWENLLQNGHLSTINNNSITIGMELFDRILLANARKDSIWKRLEIVSQKDGTGKISFPKYDELLQKTRRKIHTINRSTGELLSLKKGYQVTQATENIAGIKVTIQNAVNHAHHWNLNWICVPSLASEENKKKLEQVILAGEPNADTPNYFSRTILITENEKELEEWLLAFYRKIYGENCTILEGNLLVISLLELNQYWYEAKQEWKLL